MTIVGDYTSPIQCRLATVIRDGLVSARRPVLTILFHGQERNLATEPSLWPAQSYGTVYRQQFVKQTACIRSSASSKLIFSARQHAERAICYRPSVRLSVRLSVCPSVRLSHGWISQKRLNVSSKFFHHLIGPTF